MDSRESVQKGLFNLRNALLSVRKFYLDRVGSFFEMSEKIALQRDWDQKHWVSLITLR